MIEPLLSALINCTLMYLPRCIISSPPSHHQGQSALDAAYATAPRLLSGLSVGQLLGRGGYGSCFHATWHGAEVVLKVQDHTITGPRWVGGWVAWLLAGCSGRLGRWCACLLACWVQWEAGWVAWLLACLLGAVGGLDGGTAVWSNWMDGVRYVGVWGGWLCEWLCEWVGLKGPWGTSLWVRGNEEIIGGWE